MLDDDKDRCNQNILHLLAQHDLEPTLRAKVEGGNPVWRQERLRREFVLERDLLPHFVMAAVKNSSRV